MSTIEDQRYNKPNILITEFFDSYSNTLMFSLDILNGGVDGRVAVESLIVVNVVDVQNKSEVTGVE
jgi:hypothetical protein